MYRLKVTYKYWRWPIYTEKYAVTNNRRCHNNRGDNYYIIAMTTTEDVTTVISTEETTTIEMTTFPIVIAEQVAANGSVKEDVVISKVDGVENAAVQSERDKDDSSNNFFLLRPALPV